MTDFLACFVLAAIALSSVFFAPEMAPDVEFLRVKIFRGRPAGRHSSLPAASLTSAGGESIPSHDGMVTAKRGSTTVPHGDHHADTLPRRDPIDGRQPWQPQAAPTP